MTAEMILPTVKALILSVSPSRPESLDDDTDLFEAQVLDSFATISLIAELESKFNVRIPNEELNMENFHSPLKISQLVESLAGH
ncbi:MAG: hypothetical protein KIT15_15250 [Xanthobacteraceae bacterium]|nr:hypothetical protein [Xanthobacteraceae bacterium]